jgi:hypothetical protein
MRIPLMQVYRAFPELDSFSDEECERFVTRAKTHQGTMLMAGYAGAALAGVATSCPSGWMLWRLTHWLGRPFERPGITDDRIELEMFAIVIVGTVLAAAGVGFAVRDLTLRKAIARAITLASCPRCRYSLLGLPVERGLVQCPECGHPVNLHEMGLTPEDLISPGAGVPPRPRPPTAQQCAACSYSLRGLIAPKFCPECGAHVAPPATGAPIGPNG